MAEIITMPLPHVSPQKLRDGITRLNGKKHPEKLRQMEIRLVELERRRAA